MTICDQLGNAGSEFDRAANARLAGKTARFESALARFLELMNLTATDPRWHAGRQREILRLREMACGVLCDELPSEEVFFPYRQDFLRYGLRARNEPRPHTET